MTEPDSASAPSRRRTILGALAAILILGFLLSGIGPDLPGPRVREMLGLAEERTYEACEASRQTDLTPPPSGSRPSGEWRRVPDFPSPRDELRAVTLDGLIYLTNGHEPLEDEIVASDLVRAFDPRTGQYRPVPGTPERLDHAVAVRYRGELYVVGGYLDGEPTGRMWAYSPERQSWRELASMATARGALAGAVVGDKLYVVGGTPGTGEMETPFSSMEIYDFRSGEWQPGPEMPGERHHHAAVGLGGDLYVAGGRVPDDFSLDSFDRFDPDTETWEELPPLPQGVGGPAMVATGDHIVVTGGGDDLGDVAHDPWVTAGVWAFNLRAEKWERWPDLRHARHGHAAEVVDGDIYVFGGALCPGYGRTGSSEALALAGVEGVPAAED